MTRQASVSPTVLIFMGVAGCGKTTVARLFAAETGASFYEGDDFHPPANIVKMQSGIPLTDADRAIWLQALRQIIVRALADREFSAITCSALKEKYRHQLAAGDARVKFIHLTGKRKLIADRLKMRRDHFMPAKLLASQFAILEPPKDALVFNAALAPETIVAELIYALGIAAID